MDRPVVNLSRVRRALAAPAGGSSDFDLNPGVRRQASRPLRPASVLVPLVERGGGLRLILTRRAALLKHHPGQVAFPGGKQDAADATPLAAALREAREEIGLRPEDVEVVLDHLLPLAPRGAHELAGAEFAELLLYGEDDELDREER